jgi:tripartite-type tricarboxylate transporter receptor subunit TctC
MKNSLMMFLRFACLAVVAAIAAPVLAQSYPSQLIKIIVSYPAGGAVDAMARNLGAVITEKTGQAVIVENRPGAATSLAAQALANSRPDGYTVALLDPTTVALNQHLFKKLTYDPTALVPVTTLIRFQLVLAVPASSHYKTLKDYVDAAKAKPGSIPYASTGAGGPTHLTMERFKLAAGIDVNHVPYKGGAPVAQDLAGGQVESALMDFASAVPLIKAGQIRVLAITPTRSEIIPNVPTFAESGYPDFVAGAWSGVFAPPGTPAPMVAQLNALFREAAASQRVLSWVKSVSLEPSTTSAAEFRNIIKSDIDNYGSIIKKTGFSLE